MDFLPAELGFIKPGETWALVGDSGSGHSDLLYTITGKGIEHVSFKHHFRNLSNTTQFYYQQRFNSTDSEDAQTVHEYLVSQQSASRKCLWTYAKVISVLRLEELLSKQVIKLSNGETKRLLLATALIRNPRALLLDHPLTGLDVNARKTFGLLLEEISNSGVFVIMASDPDEIPSTISHVAVVKNGKVVYSDSIDKYRVQQFGFEAPPEPDTALLQQLTRSTILPTFDTIVRLTDVNIQYDGKKILSHVSWHVRQGERWALSGPNGAGKSTLLSLINGDNPQAYANKIVLFDRVRGSGESIWDIKTKIGFISPELYQYFPTDSTCLHVVESGFYDTVGLFRPSDPEKEKLCRQWMTLFQIQQFENKLLNMAPAFVQRLCLLARALVKNPPLLILDEPTQGLDNVRTQFFTRVIDDLCLHTDVTLIYVSHYEHHIPKAVNRRLTLNNGRVVN